MVHEYETLLGTIKSYVNNNPTKKVQPLSTVIATIQTYLNTGKVSDSQLEKIFSDVEKDILEGYFKYKPDYKYKRKRFEDLKNKYGFCSNRL